MRLLSLQDYKSLRVIKMKWSSNNAVFVLQVARPFLAFCVIILVADFLKLTPRSRGN